MSKSKKDELFWGFLLVGLGVVFLLDKLDVMDDWLQGEVYGG